MKRVLVSMPLLVLFIAWPVAATERTVRVIDPRDFGYFIGDVLRREVTITVGPDEHIAEAALPRPGPVTYWLDLRRFDVTAAIVNGQHRYRLVLEYQTFYAPLEPRRLEIPALTLQVSKGESSAGQVLVPPLPFLMSPMREIIPTAESDDPTAMLRPDKQPALQSTLHDRIAVWVSGLLSLATWILLARHFSWWPFRRRRGRPFAAAARKVAAEADTQPDLADYKQALMALHRAFDDSASHRVMADDVPRFLRERPEFAPLHEEIAAFYAQSRLAFFAGDAATAQMELPLAELRQFAAALRDYERRAA